MENNSILQKLDGLEARFEEVSTLITDPEVIADQNRFVKLTKEYKDLGDIMDARKRYIAWATSWMPASAISPVSTASVRLRTSSPTRATQR